MKSSREFLKRVLVTILLLDSCAGTSLALEIKTRDGASYKQCEVTAVLPDAIVVSHSEGVARIPFEELPTALQAQYHFDAKKVAAYHAAMAAARAAEQKRAAEERAEKHEQEAQLPNKIQPKEQRVPQEASRDRTQAEGANQNQMTPASSEQPFASPTSSPAQPSTSPEPVIPVLILVALLLGAVLWVSKVKSARLARDWKKMCADRDAYIATVDATGSLPTTETNILLKPGEEAFYHAAAALYETRAVRNYQSGSAGFRVAKGVWIGGSRGSSTSSQEWSRVDTGKLTVTNKRVVFDGEGQERTLSLAKIVSVSSLRDAVEVAVENRQKRMVFSASNPLILERIIQVAAQGGKTGNRS